MRYYVPSKLAVLKNYEFVRRRYSSRKVVALFLIDSKPFAKLITTVS